MTESHDTCRCSRSFCFKSLQYPSPREWMLYFCNFSSQTSQLESPKTGIWRLRSWPALECLLNSSSRNIMSWFFAQDPFCLWRVPVIQVPPVLLFASPYTWTSLLSLLHCWSPNGSSLLCRLPPRKSTLSIEILLMFIELQQHRMTNTSHVYYHFPSLLPQSGWPLNSLSKPGYLRVQRRKRSVTWRQQVEARAAHSRHCSRTLALSAAVPAALQRWTL